MGDLTHESSQVLTFTIGSEEYCVPIKYVAEIVKDSSIRSIPNTDPHVKGVTDLRGETTTIINPSDVLDADTAEFITEGGEIQSHIIVLDSGALGTESPTGWLVSEVKQVLDASPDDVDTTVTENNKFLHGFLKPGDDSDNFTIWVDAHELTA